MGSIGWVIETGSVTMTDRAPEGRSGPIRVFGRISLFAALGEDGLRRLAAAATVRTYRRRELIAHPRNAGECWIIAEGRARVYTVSPRGREVTIEMLPPDSVHGLVFLEGTVQWLSYLEAAVDGTVVYRIPIGVIEALCLQRPEFALAVLRLLSNRLAATRDLIEDFALADVRTRLAHTLARLATQNARHEVTESHRELAAMIGSRPEEVTKLLRGLRNEGLVAYAPDHHALLVLDVDRLASYGT